MSITDPWQLAIGFVGSLVVLWLILAGSLLLARPQAATLREVMRLLPDTLRLLRRLAVDRTVHRSVRIRLWLLLAYLALPFDLIPDFIPVIGQADDVIILCLVLRSVVRRAGPEAVARHWPGSEHGLAALWKAARLPSLEPPPPSQP